MAQLILDISDSLFRLLAKRAERKGKSPEEFVLHSLERILHETAEDPLLQVLGTLESDTPYLGQKHDGYISQALNDMAG